MINTTEKNIQNNIDITILIVTFKERQVYVQDLIKKIKEADPDINIVLAVNGNNEEVMDEQYRKNMLALAHNTSNCYAFICPQFMSLAKLWNTLVLFSSTEYNFIICDDVEYGDKDIIKQIKEYISKSKEEFFTINGGFSHFVITKQMLHKLNYFDERLCGFGEEDGDIVHSFILKERRNLPILFATDIYNKALYTIKNEHIETHCNNKPRFNREFANIKYTNDDLNGIRGMNPTPIRRILENKQQYPYEMFIKNNKHNIKKFTEVIFNYE